MSRRGVTLIETLVVLALIALFASVAVLSAPPLRSNARDEAERFAVKVTAAQSFALISGAPVQIEFAPAGYGFKSFRDGAWTDLVVDKTLRRRAFRGDVAVSLLSSEEIYVESDRRASADKNAAKRILLDPLGGGGSASVAFADGAGRWVVTLQGADPPKVSRDAG